MSPRLSQGCTWVLLLAMLLAMAAGLLAWGPMHLPALSRGPSTVWAGLPLVAVAAWGAWTVRRARWPRDLRQPWMAFFVLGGLAGWAAVLAHATGSLAAHAAAHGLSAASMTLLALAFAAERMDAWFGSRAAVVAGCGVAAGAMLWWFAGQFTGGAGDVRALVFLQCLPLLLIPAGGLSLPGGFTRSVDWLVMLALYLLARLADLLDAPLHGLTGLTGLSGHVLMHLLVAAVVAWPIYRAGAASRRAGSPAAGAGVGSASEPTQRRTSLNTSS